MGHAPGERIGRYVVEAHLGTGGMGAVYRAYDDVLRRRVALKVLSGKHDDEAAVQRILREARMAAALEHPNVVALYDFGTHEGAPYIVMEYVAGRSLRSLLRHRAAPIDERKRWLVDVANALAAAHRAGLVHRDVKPENVMVRDDGLVKVLDFGIARKQGTIERPDPTLPAAPIASDKTFATQEGQLSGTLGYMAPEQVLEKKFDARSDQFSWGVVAHEALTWKLPWPAGGQSAIATAIFDRKPLLIDHDGLPASFHDSVVRALELDPGERFASMDDLLAKLDVPPAPGSIPRRPLPQAELLDPSEMIPTVAIGAGGGKAASLEHTPVPRASDTPPPATPSSPSSPSNPTPVGRALTNEAAPPRPLKKIPRVAIIAAIGIGSLAAVFVYPISKKPPSPEVVPQVPPVMFAPEQQRKLTDAPGCQEFPSFTADGRSLVMEENTGDGSHIVAIDVASRARTEITKGSEVDLAPALSPDGRDVAFLRGTTVQTAFIAPLDASSPPRQIAEGGLMPSFSPDGKGVWAGAADKPVRFDRATLAPGRMLAAPAGAFLAMVLELADHRVAARVSGVAGGILLFPADDGPPEWLFHGATDDVLSLFREPAAGAGDAGGGHGPSLLATRVGPGETRTLMRVPIDGSKTEDLSAGFVASKGISFSPEGDRIAWSTCAKHARLLALEPAPNESFTTKPIGEPSAFRDFDISWSPATNAFLFVSERGAGVPELWRMDEGGANAARINTGDLKPMTSHISPDGKWAVFSAVDRGLFIAPIDGSAPPRQLTKNPGDEDPSFRRDGKYVFFTSRKKGVEEIDGIPFEGGTVERLVGPPSAVPVASPADDTVLYLAPAPDGDARVMQLDLATKKSVDLNARYAEAVGIAISLDGKRAAVGGEQGLVEIDVPGKKMVGKYETGSTQMQGLSYTRKGLVIMTHSFSGSVWIADHPFGARR